MSPGGWDAEWMDDAERHEVLFPVPAQTFHMTARVPSANRSAFVVSPAASAIRRGRTGAGVPTPTRNGIPFTGGGASSEKVCGSSLSYAPRPAAAHPYGRVGLKSGPSHGHGSFSGWKRMDKGAI
jgi:hypothetical protein